MPIYAFDGKKPIISETSYVSPTAVIVGNVVIGERCYIGHGAILRGDWGSIEIGDETAVEEAVFIHARPGDTTRVGKRVTLGHGALVHNAIIQEGAVIGMRAVISDFSVVGSYSIIGEMGLVKRNQNIPERKIAVGIPARVIGSVDDERLELHLCAKDLYANLAQRCSEGALEEIEPPIRLEEKRPQFVPIGVIHTPFEMATGTPIQGALSPDVEGEVVLEQMYREGLQDLEGFSHAVLIYYFDRIHRFELRMKPYLDENERGIFATRSPCRPNPIGLTVVRLMHLDGHRIKVSGVDMLDGTPLLDIKPYVPAFDHQEDVRCGWFEPHLERLKNADVVPVADGRFHDDDKTNNDVR